MSFDIEDHRTFALSNHPLGSLRPDLSALNGGSREGLDVVEGKMGLITTIEKAYLPVVVEFLPEDDVVVVNYFGTVQAEYDRWGGLAMIGITSLSRYWKFISLVGSNSDIEPDLIDLCLAELGLADMAMTTDFSREKVYFVGTTTNGEKKELDDELKLTGSSSLNDPLIARVGLMARMVIMGDEDKFDLAVGETGGEMISMPVSRFANVGGVISSLNRASVKKFVKEVFPAIKFYEEVEE